MSIIKTFNDFNLLENHVEKLKTLSITEPTEIQKQVIPLILDNKNVIFQSETGTGKTFAFLLPLLKKIDVTNKNVQLIIIAPTQELASQIKMQIQLLDFSSVALFFGGSPIKRQIEKLKEKPLILVGTAERILELYFLKKLKLDSCFSLVLDETDRLLSVEMKQKTLELVEILSKQFFAKQGKMLQLIACSATIKDSLSKELQRSMKTSDDVKADFELVLLPREGVLTKNITHWAIYSEQRNKIDTLIKLLNATKPTKCLVFTSNASQIANITDKLKYKKIDCAGLHAKTDKVTRKQVIDRFRSGKNSLLVTSDLTARGLDIAKIDYIIQMDLPKNDDFFIHRAGRTGRAGLTGTNVVIGDAWEMEQFSKLEKRLKIIVYPKVLYNGKVENPKLEEVPE